MSAQYKTFGSVTRWSGVNSETVVALSVDGIVIDNSVPNNYSEWKPKEIQNPGWFRNAFRNNVLRSRRRTKASR